MKYKSDQVKPILKAFKCFRGISRNMSRLFPYKGFCDLTSADAFSLTSQPSRLILAATATVNCTEPYLTPPQPYRPLCLFVFFPCLEFLTIFYLSYAWLNPTHSLRLSSRIFPWLMQESFRRASITPAVYRHQTALYCLLCLSFYYIVNFLRPHSIFCPSHPVQCQKSRRYIEKALDLEL